jgi:hypothetical protein
MVRRTAGIAAVVVACAVPLAACSVPTPQTLDCTDGQSVYTCKSKFSDGKSRSIVFVDSALPEQVVLDIATTKDDFGNPFCVTLYDNATATFVGGEC